MKTTGEDDTGGAEPQTQAGRRNVDRMGGFAKGLAVIEAFGHGRATLTIAEAARLSGLDRATARRCLLTLVEGGYATSEGPYFELTPRILRLGHSYLSAPLPRLIQPYLDQLAGRLQESCSAAVLDGRSVVYVARAAHHRFMGVGLHPGSRLPAYCTSLGRALLSGLPPADARHVISESDRHRFTERTLTNVEELVKEVDRVREQGYSVIDQEIEMGSRSIAIPVRNRSGRTILAITVGVAAGSASVERMKDEFLPYLRETQTQLAAVLP